jgi:hypothetical protein
MGRTADAMGSSSHGLFRASAVLGGLDSGRRKLIRHRGKLGRGRGKSLRGPGTWFRRRASFIGRRRRSLRGCRTLFPGRGKLGRGPRQSRRRRGTKVSTSREGRFRSGEARPRSWEVRSRSGELDPRSGEARTRASDRRSGLDAAMSVSFGGGVVAGNPVNPRRLAALRHDPGDARAPRTGSTGPEADEAVGVRDALNAAPSPVAHPGRASHLGSRGGRVARVVG